MKIAVISGNFLAGVATDEENPDLQVDQLAKSLTFALETGHTAPRNFWGVGGMKIFRDLIYQMRGMMRADHKFYKKQGIYDFPQKKQLTSLKMYLVGMLLSNGMPASMAKGIVAGLPQSAKDRLAADLLNANGEKVCQKMEELAAGKGVHVCVSAVHAEVK